MRIENDIKLDFKDVLIRPKRSTLNSRSEVSLERYHTFRNARTGDGDSWVFKGIPIMAANMDGVGTFEMAESLAKRGLFTCLVKHYPKHELRNWISEIGAEIKDYWAYSLGSRDEDLVKFDAVYAGTVDSDMVNRAIKYVCIDVANGYSERFSGFVKKFREAYPRVIIIAGNVVTGEMTEELILNGADIVKVGIGPGCFVPGSIVNTSFGPKPIEEIAIGDKVKTHLGNWKSVTNKFKFTDKKKIVKVNNIEATPNHEFYVVHREHISVLTDDNIHNYAKWISAEKLTKDYLLIKHS